MEIKFELSLEDAWEYSKLLRVKVPKIRNITIANLLLGFLLILIVTRNLIYSLCSLAIIIVIQFLLIREH